MRDAKRAGGVTKYINPKGMAVLNALDDAAKKHNASNTTVALAWLLTTTLLLPALDYARSPRALVTLVDQHVPEGACVRAPGMTRANVAALEVFGHHRVRTNAGAGTVGNPGGELAGSFPMVQQHQRPGQEQQPTGQAGQDERSHPPAQSSPIEPQHIQPLTHGYINRQQGGV